MERIFKNNKIVMVIFQKEDFTLCDVPVPKGYPQSQTHAGISYCNQKIGGYNYFLTSSPFPNVKYCLFKRLLRCINRKIFNINNRGEDFENPMFYYGKIEKKNVPPTKFISCGSNPLMQKPKDIYGNGSFNSDPDLFIYDKKIYVLNRQTQRIIKEGNKKYETKVFLIECYFNEKNDFKIKSISERFLFNNNPVSPCLTFFESKFRYFYLITNSYNDGSKCEKMYLHSDFNINGEFSEKKEISIISEQYQPWHFSVFQFEDKLYAIVACVLLGQKGRCYQMMGEFDNNLDTLLIYEKPLTDLMSYRGSACVTEDSVFVLYSTTVHEKFKNAKSIDGRDIIMASKPFKSLLEELKRNNE